MSSDLGPDSRIELAREAEFDLGAIKVRPALCEVVVAGEARSLQPRVMQVLVCLSRRRGEVASRDELVTRCWDGLAVSEDSISRCISQLRKLAEDSGAFAIDTIARVGYRLTAPNLTVRGDTIDVSKPALNAAPQSATAEAVLQRPAVAILPFLNLSGDISQDYFADGITEDLITALSAWRWFPVIARNSSFVYKGQAVDVIKVGEELGVRYVVEGSVRRVADRVRINVQLIDASNALHLWVQMFDREIGDVFALQDEITRSIVTAIEPQLTRAEQQRALRKPPENLDAWDLSLQGLALIRKGTTQALAEAESLLVRAVTLDHRSSYAQSLLALARWHTALSGWTKDPVRALSATYEAASTAVEIDDCDWLAHALLGIAALWYRGAHEQAVAEEETAIALNPSAAFAYHLFGCVIIFDGRPEIALSRSLAITQLDPRYQFLSTVHADVGLAHFLMGDCDAAIKSCERSIAEQRGNVRAWQRKAAALGSAGRIAEAKAAFEQVLNLQPGFSQLYVSATYPFKNSAHTQMFDAGLKLAGWTG